MAAALGLAFFGVRASWVVVVGEDPEPPFSAALGLAAALVLVFFDVSASWIAVVGGDPRTLLLRGTRPYRCARFGLLRRACEFDCFGLGRLPKPPFSAAFGLAAKVWIS
jgi:hypothetical protein